MTFGMSGLLYMIFAKRGQSPQFKFHAFQSIFLALLGMVVAGGSQPLFMLLAQMVALVSSSAAGMLNSGFGVISGIVSLAFLCLSLYGAIWAFLGKFAEIPFVSDLIHRNMSAQ